VDEGWNRCEAAVQNTFALRAVPSLIYPAPRCLQGADIYIYVHTSRHKGAASAELQLGRCCVFQRIKEGRMASALGMAMLKHHIQIYRGGGRLPTQ
jgi:hypothetical protein